ncbi:MAG: ABC transporter ATP-binding protein [Euryarchaeota archaeon]|nr:ABC transporter ATP-binding protein [Euryarchaeota archaeon]
MNAIGTTQLTKVYSDWRGREEIRAVDSLNLKVKKGEIFGFLGPNGAGKTTTVKMLLGLVFPTSGEFTLLGEDLSVEIKRRIGYLPEEPQFPSYFTAEEALSYYADLYGIEKEKKQKIIKDILKLVSLNDTGKKKVSQFSKGMKQRLGIAQALLNDPELVFLDEPTSGLDPAGRKDIKDLLTNLKSQGTTVFLNSHILSEVEKVCDRVGIINNGELVSTGTIEDLTSTNSVEIRAEMDRRTIAMIKEKTSTLNVHENAYIIEVEHMDIVPELAEIIVTNGGKLKALIPKKQSLEDTFLEVVGE